MTKYKINFDAESEFFKAFAEMPNEFTSNAFIKSLIRHGVEDRKIRLDWPRAFLGLYATQAQRYAKSWRKKTYNELTQLTPKTPNLPPISPQSLFNEKSANVKELKGYTDKELAEELKKRGFKVMVQEITYKEI